MQVRATETFYAFLDGSWVDITADVVNNTSAEWGMRSGDHTDRLARVGSLTLYLDNVTTVGKYSPGHPNVRTGWAKGVWIKHVFTYSGTPFVRFRGFVDAIQNFGRRMEFKRVTVLEWLELAARHPIQNPGLLTNKTGDEVIDEVLALMPIQPQATSLDVGVNTFPTAFDTVTSKTKAMNEFSKVALSEIGHVYLRHDQINGETLVFENAKKRNGLRTLTGYNGEPDTGFLKKSDGGYLLKSDGGKFEISFTPPVITLTLDDDSSVLNYEFEDGENIKNRFTVYAIPRREDTSNQILFKLDAPQPISSGQTIIIKGTYANPDGGLPINANPANMVNPVATTDYRAFSNSDGTGTEFTASLTVTASYGTNGFSHTVYNASSNSGHITLFNCRGKGIYTYNPIEHQANDTDSQNNYGIISDAMTQKYKNDLTYGLQFADFVVDEEKDPRTILKKITLTANKDTNVMRAFLQLDIGDIIRVTESKSNTDAYYFIQGVSYQTRPGGIVMFDWILKPFLCLALGMSELGIEFNGHASTDGIDFGQVPQVRHLTDITYSAWYKAGSGNSWGEAIISNNAGDGIGSDAWSVGAGFFHFINWRWSTDGIWYRSFSPTTGVWYHLAMTYNFSTSSVPKFYINGVEYAPTFSLQPTGAAFTERPQILVIGNKSTNNFYYTNGVKGQLKDVRVYNRILSAAEITTLYNSGTPDMDLVTDGLQFQTFVIPTNRLTSYTDATLTSDMKLRDRIYGMIGTPHGSPIGRTP